MDIGNGDQGNISSAIERRDRILIAITSAAERFLRGSLDTWQENMVQVIRELGLALGVKRIYVLKHKEVTAEKVVTGLRYEWSANGDKTRVDVMGLQDIDLQQAGFSRWAEVLYRREVIYGSKEDLPPQEQGWFMSERYKTQLVVSVYVEDQWWGFLGFEDYASDAKCSLAEIDAFNTIAVTFGAAIRRKRMEESLRREQASVMQKIHEVEDLARFPAEAPIPVLRLSRNGVVLYGNRSSEGVLRFWNIQPGEQLPELWRGFVNEAMEKKESKAEDINIDGKVYSLLFVPIMDADYVNVYGTDVTRERELANMKSQFISMASHQLRTPLTTMRWRSETLLENPEGFSEKQLTKLEAIHSSTVQLSELIDDLLNISRIERGALEPDYVEADLLHMIAETVAELDIQAKENNISITQDFQSEVGNFFFDKKLIRQVVINLISNAIKYTPAGGKVKISVLLRDSSVVVDVSDTGMGIAEEERESIFGRFYRSRRAIESGITGTGLGLSVVKMIVDSCEGSAWFNSEVGRGSTFSFSLPYHKTKPGGEE